MYHYIIKGEFKGVVQDILKGSDYFEQWKKEHNEPDAYLVDENQLKKMIVDHSKSLIGNWEEITEEKYWEMLEVLPPMRFEADSFFICEPFQYDLHSFYIQVGSKYYTSLQPIGKPKSEILSNLIEWMEK